jgi:Protein of unknown function (DUF1579)
MTRNNLKLLVIAASSSLFGAAHAQGPIQVFNRILGTWVGKTKFNSDNPMLQKPIDASVKITTAVKGHYIQFERVLYLAGAPEDTLSLLTFDRQAGLFEMWTFNQHSPGARLLSGVFDEKGHLTLISPAILESGGNVAYREIFHIDSPDKFTIEYDVRTNDKWHEDFTTTYIRKTDSTK